MRPETMGGVAPGDCCPPRRRRIGGATLMLLAGLALCQLQSARAQELNPRAYLITPTDTNAVSLGYTYLDGNVQFDGAVPITDATSSVNLAALGYYHSFDLAGHSANFALALPYGYGDFSGTVVDVPKHGTRSGLLDSSLRVAVNLLGGPAMGPADFARWSQHVLLGVSLKIVAPIGQYDPTLLVNFGNNRWAFKPELGLSQRWGHWVLDTYLGGWFFTRNSDFLGNHVQEQRPMGAFEAHLSYDIAPRLWLSLDANYWWGGETSLDGTVNPLTVQQNSRVGVTASIPLTQRQSIKLSYSDGAYVSYGGNYRAFGLTWQYGWVGGLPSR